MHIHIHSLRHHVAQVQKDRATLRSSYFGVNLKSFRFWLFTNRVAMGLGQIVLLALDHPLLNQSFFFRIKYNMLVYWCYHLFFAFFMVTQTLLMAMPEEDIWPRLTNYLLVQVPREYNHFVLLEVDDSNRGRKLHQQREWRRVNQRYPLIRQLSNHFPIEISWEKLTAFACNFRPVHVPRAPFRCKLQMILVGVSVELAYWCLMVGGALYFTILCTSVLILQLINPSEEWNLWILSFRLLEIFTFIHEMMVRLGLTGYLMLGALLLVFTGYVNLKAYTRSLMECTGRGSRRRQLSKRKLVLSIHRYKRELLRSVGLLRRANQSWLGRFLVPLVLAINVPINIVLVNMAWWQSVGAYSQSFLVAFLLFQIALILGLCDLFARASSMIHSTRSCFVPLQCKLAEGEWHTKLTLMVMHEQINSDKTIAMNLAGMAPMTRKNMAQFVLIYIIQFLTVTKLFI